MTTRPADLFTGPGPVGSPVLFVNGDPLTVQDVLEPIIDDLNRQARRLRRRDYNDYLARRLPEEIRNRVSRLVVSQRAKDTYPEEAHKIMDAKADDMIKDVINRRFGGVHARYEQHLKAFDFTVADMKERAKRQILVTQFLRDRFLPRLQEPPRRELMKYYQAHLDEFTTPATAELFLIEVPIQVELDKPTSEATGDEIAAARGLARAQLDRAREELNSGVEFAAVAKLYSRGIHRVNGGAWGEISPGALKKRWAGPAEVLFTLEPGQISDVAETDESVFIVKCGRKTPGNRLSFEEAQAGITTRLKNEQYDRMTHRYISDLLRRATIDDRQQQGFFFAVAAAAPRPSGTELVRENRKEQ